MRAYLPLIGVTELLIVPMFCIGIVNVCKIGGVKSYFFWKTFIESLACSFILHFLFLNGISFITNNPLVMFITVLGCSLLCSIIIEFIKSKIHI